MVIDPPGTPEKYLPHSNVGRAGDIGNGVFRNYRLPHLCRSPYLYAERRTDNLTSGKKPACRCGSIREAMRTDLRARELIYPPRSSPDERLGLMTHNSRLGIDRSYQASQLQDASRNCVIFIVPIVWMQEIGLNCENAAEACVRQH